VLGRDHGTHETLERVRREAEGGEPAEEEVVGLGALVARVADGLLEGVDRRGELLRREFRERGHALLLTQRGAAQHERAHEQARVELLRLGDCGVHVRLRRLGEPAALDLEVVEAAELERVAVSGQDVTE
jgi:hypothetical protein